MQVKPAAVAHIHGGVLRLIGVVDHAVFAVLYISVDLHIVVGGEPLVQLRLRRSRPQHCTVLEHYVLHKLRNDPAFVPELDFVMLKDGKLIGQNMFMKAVIVADDDRSIPIMEHSHRLQ